MYRRYSLPICCALIPRQQHQQMATPPVRWIDLHVGYPYRVINHEEALVCVDEVGAAAILTIQVALRLAAVQTGVKLNNNLSLSL